MWKSVAFRTKLCKKLHFFTLMVTSGIVRKFLQKPKTHNAWTLSWESPIRSIFGQGEKWKRRNHQFCKGFDRMFHIHLQTGARWGFVTFLQRTWVCRLDLEVPIFVERANLLFHKSWISTSKIAENRCVRNILCAGEATNHSFQLKQLEIVIPQHTIFSLQWKALHAKECEFTI